MARSALTSAFEELALRGEKEEGEEGSDAAFSAHPRVCDGGGVFASSEPREPSFSQQHALGGGRRRDLDLESDLGGTAGSFTFEGGRGEDAGTSVAGEGSAPKTISKPISRSSSQSRLSRGVGSAGSLAASAGRQHGSSSMLSILAEGRMPRVESSNSFSFHGGEPEFLSCAAGDVGERGAKSEANYDLAFQFTSTDSPYSSLFTSLDSPMSPHLAQHLTRGERSAHVSHDSREAKEMEIRGGSTHGVRGERSLRFSKEYMHPAGVPRLVVVHTAEDQNSKDSAGRKTRGSNNLLLLLEAHELSMGCTPTPSECDLSSVANWSEDGMSSLGPSRRTTFEDESVY